MINDMIFKIKYPNIPSSIVHDIQKLYDEFGEPEKIYAIGCLIQIQYDNVHAVQLFYTGDYSYYGGPMTDDLDWAISRVERQLREK